MVLSEKRTYDIDGGAVAVAIAGVPAYALRDFRQQQPQFSHVEHLLKLLGEGGRLQATLPRLLEDLSNWRLSYPTLIFLARLLPPEGA
jgi:hypothetical protein